MWRTVRLAAASAAVISVQFWGAAAFGQTQRPVPRPAVSWAEALPVVKVSAREVLRPQLRPMVVTVSATPDAVYATEEAGFQRWVRSFRARALAQGIGAATFESAFRGVRYDPEIIARDRNQSEFTKTIWQYLDSAASDTRIANGQAALRAHGDVLSAIEARYGVEKEVVVAVWGLESAYGTYKGGRDVVRSLATLAYDGRRGQFFEGQLVAALQILQSGDTAPRDMTGSWAGAMGHTQFIPTSYLEYAVDFDGDGKRNIWSEDPTDALASTAAYLARHGWTKGQPWGVEVRLPAGFDYALADRKVTRSAAEWARLGVIGADGAAVPDHGAASILLPAGSRGVALMIFRNFAVIERYNAADAYVIGVGHLSDRIGGGAAFKADWPREDRALSRNERKEMQRRLTARGFSTQGVDGLVGPNTLKAVRAFQLAEGLTPDGYASYALLKRLR